MSRKREERHEGHNRRRQLHHRDGQHPGHDHGQRNRSWVGSGSSGFSLRRVDSARQLRLLHPAEYGWPNFDNTLRKS